jgi:hypothetical protein
VKRVTKVINWYQFVFGIVLGIYVGFSRLMLFQPGRAGRGRHLAAHHAGDGAVAVFVRGGEDLESCGANRREFIATTTPKKGCSQG